MVKDPRAIEKRTTTKHETRCLVVVIITNTYEKKCPTVVSIRLESYTAGMNIQGLI